MPIRLLRCNDCNEVYEKMELTDEQKEEEPVCPYCGSKKYVKRIGRTNFKLVGRGWANTGYDKYHKKPD